MHINVDLGQMQQEMIYALQYCADHEQCKDCVIKSGQVLHIGNSVIYCEHFKGDNNEGM